MGCLALAAMSASESYSRFADMNLISRCGGSFLSLVDEARELPALLSGGRLSVAASQRAVMDRARAEFPLGSVSGKVDLFPLATWLLVANGLDYRPRPTLSSYSSYTPFLAAANAEFLRGPAAPDTVFLEFDPIDSRLPTQEDPLCWLELARLYDVEGVRSECLLLRRSPTPRALSFRRLGSLSGARFVERVVLPKFGERSALWVRVQTRMTMMGRAANLLYKPAATFIHFEMPDKTVEKYRFLSASAAGGFLLSPLILDEASFSQWQSGVSDQAKMRPTAIYITGSDDKSPQWCYGAGFDLDFFEVAMSPRAGNWSPKMGY